MTGVRERVRRRWYTSTLWRWWNERWVRRMALKGMIWRTGNFAGTTWLGRPVWQNPLDAWALQEAIVHDGVDLVIECGTNRGGSAYYMASVFDLIGRGRVITIDVESLADFQHDRIEFLKGSSVDPELIAAVRARVDELAPSRTMVLLDSDHAGPHVLRELELYSEFVPIGGYVVVQDGCIDELAIMRDDRPGPLWALRQFIANDPNFEIDEARSGRYLLSHSPSGWLRRRS
ncbi:MAG: class I SAM-dependent methyltransferase [Acidimicrobiia bacterium]|nr:class I SAM-dependent methyltransferase [Acidimicrobiia bacterium]